MANYYCRTRTNYFHVKDPDAFRSFMAGVKGDEGDVVLREEKDSCGNLTFGFITYGGIMGVVKNEDDECDNDACQAEFIAALQEHVVPGDAIIITEVGWEAIRYLVGVATVITCDDVRHISISDESLKIAKVMLHNPDWVTQNDY